MDTHTSGMSILIRQIKENVRLVPSVQFQQQYFTCGSISNSEWSSLVQVMKHQAITWTSFTLFAFGPLRTQLTHWGRDKMAAVSQTTHSNAFSWMKMLEFRLRFHWSLFLRVQINNNPALVQIMAWRRPGDKPLSEPMMVSLLTHICVTRPQWVKWRSNQDTMISFKKMHFKCHLQSVRVLFTT